tara:strand:- start:1531 stop:2817 length:1287 start_codon:yes stop_codon:yes gene_type:complete
MTKARDLANIISGGFTADDIPNLDASKITSGSFADARIPNLATSKITSGTFDDARIAASNVSQHATSFDDNKLVNDLSTLGLRVHTQENLNISNSNSASFDVFNDATGVTSFTNATRNAVNKYCSPETLSSTAEGIDYGNPTPSNYQFTLTGSWTGGAQSSFTNAYASYFGETEGIATNSLWAYSNTAPSSSQVWTLDYKEAKNFGGSIAFGGMDYTAYVTQWKIEYSLDNVSYTAVDMSGCSNGSSVSTTSGKQKTFSSGTNAGIVNFTGNAGGYDNWMTRVDGVPSFTARYIRLQMLGRNTGTFYALSIFEPYHYPTVTNATGSFQGVAITAPSATTSMGAVITYQDAGSGTNTLNTDLILKLSADNGSNFSTATLTALPDFSTGIKMAKVNDLSVTSGTQLKYKFEFANQGASKLARIRGVSLQY